MAEDKDKNQAPPLEKKQAPSDKKPSSPLAIEEKLVALGVEVRNLSVDVKKALHVTIGQQNILDTLIADHQKNLEKTDNFIKDTINKIPDFIKSAAAIALKDIAKNEIQGFKENANLAKSEIKSLTSKTRESIEIIRTAGKEMSSFVKSRSFFFYVSVIALSVIGIIGTHFYYQQYSEELSIMRAERAKLHEFGIDAWLDPGENSSGLWVVLPRGTELDTSKPRLFDKDRQGWKIAR